MCKAEQITNMIQMLVNKEIIVELRYSLLEPGQYYYVFWYRTEVIFPRTGASDDELVKDAWELVKRDKEK